MSLAQFEIVDLDRWESGVQWSVIYDNWDQADTADPLHSPLCTAGSLHAAPQWSLSRAVLGSARIKL